MDGGFMANAINLFLSHDEVAFLTGRKRFGCQKEQLAKQGIPYTLNAVGRPIVFRAVIDGSSKATRPTAKWEPRKK